MSGFTVERNAFLAALTAARGVISRRNTIPILSNVLLKAVGDELHIIATNLDMELQASCSAEFDGFEEDTVAGHALASFVDKAREDKLIKVVSDGKAIKFQSARTRTTLASLPPSNFPIMKQVDAACDFELDATAFKAILDKCGKAVSTEETRYYLNGIFMHCDDEGHLIFVATDGHRLTKCAIAAPEGATATMPAVIIPRNTLAVFASMLTEAEKSKVTPNVSLSDRQIRMSVGGTTFSSKLIDGSFPEYERVIPKGNLHRFTVATDEMAHSMERMATLPGSNWAVRFEFGEDAVVITRFNPEMDESIVDEIPCECHGEPVQIGFNGKYAAELMTSISTDTFDIWLNDSQSPSLIRPTGSDDQTSVLMPMRVQYA